jgi:hypothetical protein
MKLTAARRVSACRTGEQGRDRVLRDMTSVTQADAGEIKMLRRASGG